MKKYFVLFVLFFLSFSSPAFARFIDLGKTTDGRTLLIETLDEIGYDDSGTVFFIYYLRDFYGNLNRRFASTNSCKKLISPNPFDPPTWDVYLGGQRTQEVKAESQAAMILIRNACKNPD